MADGTSNPACPPFVRIGIVLPVDRRASLDLRFPYGGYRVDGRTVGHARLSAHADGDGVAVQADGKHIGRRDRWHLAPVGGRCGEFGGEPAAGVAARSDVLGVIVEGCVAGRGFHWQSGHDVTLAGDLELSVVDSALMLVNVLPIEPYLEGVITSEMSGECPRAFMRAHAVVARSWIAAASERKHQSLGIDFCNDDCCQRYQGTAAVTPAARSAVSDTRGQVLIHRGGAVVDANYAKCCGGITESGDEVWGHAKSGQRGSVDAPASDRMHAFARVGDNNIAEYVAASIVNETRAYCSPAVVPAEVAARCLGRVDDGSTHFRWRVGYRADQLVDILQRKGLDRIGRTGSDGIAALRDLRVTRRARGGRAIDLTVEYVDRDDRHRSLAIHDQYWIRHALHESFLYSSAFDVRIERDDHDRVLSVELIGAGWGHGAGMCQVGALGMALQGFDHSAILAHYFDGSSVDAHGGHT